MFNTGKMDRDLAKRTVAAAEDSLSNDLTADQRAKAEKIIDRGVDKLADDFGSMPWSMKVLASKAMP